MAIPTVNSVGTYASGPGAISPAPGTHATDDIEILLIETQTNEAATLSTAAGFTELTAVSPQTTGGVGGARMTVFWRRWNGTDGTPTIADSGDHQQAQIISVSGCITSGDPWDITATGTTDTTADTTVSVSGGTTTVADCLVVLMVAQSLPDAVDSGAEFSSWTNADLANVTERMDHTTASGNGGAIGMATGEKASAGAFGATTATAATSALRVCAMVALKPPSSGATVAFDVGHVVF